MPTVRKRRSRKNARINTTQYGRKLKKRNKKNCRIALDCVRERWDVRKTLRQNLTELGLSFDPNKTIPVKQKDENMEEEGMKQQQQQEPLQSNSDLIAELEQIASQPQPSKPYIMSPSEAKFIAYLITKHCSNYKKMVKDKKNYNQLTEGQLRRKCVLFHKSPHVYLLDSDIAS